jgi:hypothetical protein
MKDGKPLGERIPSDLNELERRMEKVIEWITVHYHRCMNRLRVSLLDCHADKFDEWIDFLERAINDALQQGQISQDQATVLRCRWLKRKTEEETARCLGLHKHTLRSQYTDALENVAPFIQWDAFRGAFDL